MRINARVFVFSSPCALLAVLCSALAAQAQTPAAPSSRVPAATASASEDPRPGTPTFLGDTGIWYVPTGEVLARRTWSVGGDRRGTNYVQGSSNVGDLAGTAAFGASDRVELFGAFLFDTRINRDDAPVFSDEAREGGIIARYPRVSESWTGDNVGDLYIGTKVNLFSQYRGSPLALAVRGIVKLPTGDEAVGNSTGKTDVMADLIVSREIARFFEVASYAGYEVRGKPSGVEAPGGSYRWGTGVAFPSRSPLRLSAEANGDLPTNYRATLTDNSVVGDDGSVRPLESDIRNRTRATGGLTYQTRSGVFMGTGLSWNAPRYWDWQVRIGYHGRSRSQIRSVVSVTTVALPTTAASAIIAAAPVAAPAPRSPDAPRTAAPADITFEDIYFALDGFTPNAVALAVLNTAANTLLANPTLNVAIEGHTCDIGTAEYNLALGERRANAVQAYFLSRGVAASRMRTASFGEESHEHVNEHEEARRLNRRVALVVNLR